MSAASAVMAGRIAAERQFTDTFAAYSPGAKTTDAGGFEVDGFTAEGTTLGKVPNKSGGGDASNTRYVTIGGTERPVVQGGLHLVWAASPEVGWEYELTALGRATHPSMLGKRYRVVEAHPASMMTAWRLDVVDVT